MDQEKQYAEFKEQRLYRKIDEVSGLDLFFM